MNRSEILRYCVKCERRAKHQSFGLYWCDYHVDPDVDESTVPRYKGTIPEDACCFEPECTEEPTHILGGTCFCDEHYEEAKRGGRLFR